MHPIIQQTIYYAVVMLITVFLIGIFQRGFFFKFLRVKMSFGKLILVKIKNLHNDYYRVGDIEDGFLKFKDKKDGKKYECRIVIKSRNAIYRSMSVLMVDVDELKNCILEVDQEKYNAVQGFDPVKIDELILRAIHAPDILDAKQKLMMIIAVITLIAVGALAWISWKGYQDISVIKSLLSSTAEAVRNIPKPGNI